LRPGSGRLGASPAERKRKEFIEKSEKKEKKRSRQLSDMGNGATWRGRANKFWKRLAGVGGRILRSLPGNIDSQKSERVLTEGMSGERLKKEKQNFIERRGN